MAVYTIDFTCAWKPSASYVDITSYVVSVEGDNSLSSNAQNPLAFGDAGTQAFTVNVRRAMGITGWELAPIRVPFTRTATTVTNFYGVVTDYDGDLDTVALKCRGYATLISLRTRDIYSPAYYRRPAATKTTGISVEDPTSGSYRAGLINYILWQAGGRPYEQAGSYPTADFYYSCDQAILAPDWSWLAGEDGWQELQKLAQAAGGQVFQSGAGVVMYRQPLSFASGSAVYTFTQSVYQNVQESASTGQVMTKAVVPYVPRVARATQEAVNDTTARLIGASAVVPIVLTPKLPLKSLEYAPGSSSQLAAAAIQATFFDGVPVPQGGTGYTHTLTFAAQRITLTLTNATARPFTVNRIILRGEPISAGEGGMATAGSGTNALTKEDNPYVQSLSHGNRLAAIALAIYGVARPVRKVSGCPYDPDRAVYETVNLTCPELGLSAVPHVIISKKDDDTGAISDYEMVSVAGLPTTADYFLVGSTNYTGLTRKIGW